MDNLFCNLYKTSTLEEKFEQKLIKLLTKQAEINNSIIALVLDTRKRLVSLEKQKREFLED